MLTFSSPLTQVADQSRPLSLNACQHALNQCALREEWRCGREQALLDSIGTSCLVSCIDPEGQKQQQQQLVDQLKAMRQVPLHDDNSRIDHSQGEQTQGDLPTVYISMIYAYMLIYPGSSYPMATCLCHTD